MLVEKYCKFKAATILKCIKQGAEPQKGNPNQTSRVERVLPPVKKTTQPPLEIEQVPSSIFVTKPGEKISKENSKYAGIMAEAKKLAEYAVNEMQLQNPKAAKEFLTKALENICKLD